MVRRARLLAPESRDCLIHRPPTHGGTRTGKMSLWPRKIGEKSFVPFLGTVEDPGLTGPLDIQATG